MKFTLAYGKTGLRCEVPDANVVGPLEIRPAPPLPDPAAAVRDSLSKPTGTPPLAELAAGQTNGVRPHLRRHPPRPE